MIKEIRKAVGLWLAIWLLMPATLFLLLAYVIHYTNNGMTHVMRRYDVFLKRVLRNLDDWVKHGRKPMEGGQ